MTPKVDISQLDALARVFLQIMSKVLLAPGTCEVGNDLTGAQKKILHLIGNRGPQKMGEIARQVSLTMSGATGVVDRMVKAGLVDRVFDPADRRVILIDLSEQGRDILGQLQQMASERWGQLLEYLEPAKRDELIAHFERIHELLLEIKEADHGPDR